MKKYNQCILLLLVIFSTTFLFVYRNEYLKLRTTFEVLDVFDQPIKPKDCLVLNETVEKDFIYRNLYSRPAPHWTRVGDNYVYSAFWSEGSARSVGIGPTGSNKDYGCHVWYDHQDTIFSRTGKFSYLATVGSHNGSFSLYEFICEVDTKKVKGIPYVFVFIYTLPGGDTIKSFIPIFTGEANASIENSTALCIRPDMIGRSKNEIVEFVGFHQVVGVTNFIAYDLGIQDGILAKLKMLEGLAGSVSSFSVLAWNFPFNAATLSDRAMELDCVLRTSNRVRFVGIVDWNQYIVPKYSLLHSLANVDYNDPVLLQLTVQICCLNLRDDKQSDKTWPLVLRKSRCSTISGKEGSLIVNPSVRNAGQHHTHSVNIFMSWFHDCDESQKEMAHYDARPKKYLDNLMTNKLLRIWKSGTLFTNS